jgi:1,4-dihydroxy-2-naphthoate polyprenyltransferase
MKRLVAISWFDKNTVQHLRFPFSFFLMPVFLFALSQAEEIHWRSTVLCFLIIHLLVFPSSNGYNSYQDRDETSIGGLKHPPKVSLNLFYATLLFDALAIISGLFISFYFVLFVMIFILMSRAYSYRGIRLKKYPVIGFLTVFVFQGGFVYLMASSAISGFSLNGLLAGNNLLCMSVASLFIGSAYPLTQIYQHEADKKDGVISISYKLGYGGTFIFSAILFTVGVVLLFLYFNFKHQLTAFVLFLLLMLPVIWRLNIWFGKVRKNTADASFENTMAMNRLMSVCMNSFFLLLILNHTWNWF